MPYVSETRAAVKAIRANIETSWHELIVQSLRGQYLQAAPYRNQTSTPEQYQLWKYARRALNYTDISLYSRDGQRLLGDSGRARFERAFASAQRCQQHHDQHASRALLPFPADWLVLRTTKAAPQGPVRPTHDEPFNLLLEPFLAMAKTAIDMRCHQPEAAGWFNLAYFFGSQFASHQDLVLTTSPEFLRLGQLFLHTRFRVAVLAGGLSYSEACSAFVAPTRECMESVVPPDYARLPEIVPALHRPNTDPDDDARKQQERMDRYRYEFGILFHTVQDLARELAWFTHTQPNLPYIARRNSVPDLQREIGS